MFFLDDIDLQILSQSFEKQNKRKQNLKVNFLADEINFRITFMFSKINLSFHKRTVTKEYKISIHKINTEN